MRGECPECGRVLTVKMDGTMRHHANKRKPMNGPWRPRCEGSDRYPVGVAGDE